MRIKSLLTTLTVILTTISMTACAQSQSQGQNGDKGASDFVKEFNISSFCQIDAETVGNIQFVQTGETSARAEGDEVAVNNISITTDGDKLIIRSIDKKLHNGKKFKNLKLTIFISSPQLTRIDQQGVGNFLLTKTVETDNLKIDYDGVGNLSAENLICNNLDIDYEGVGNVKLKGKTTTAIYKSEGVGNIQADEMIAQHLTVRANGVGNVKCHAAQSIDVVSSGVGNVSYYGKPEVKKVSKNGIGKIQER